MTDGVQQDTSIRRRAMLQLIAMGGVAAALTPAMPGRSAQAKGPPAAPTGRVVVGLSQEPTVFNPLMPHIEVDDAVHFSVFDALVRITPDGKFVPNLAAEVPDLGNGGVSADGLQWRVKLRDGVRWHDGTPFTAEDVKFTLELIVNPKFRAWRTSGHSLVRDITVHSPTEISWRMQEAFAPYLAFLAETFMVPKHILGGEADPSKAAFNQAPVGTGAFKWGSRVAGDRIELVANTAYAGGSPHIERLVFKYVPDLTVLYTQFRSGAVDLVDQAYITADHYAEARKLPGKAVSLEYSPTVESIYFNLERPQFKELAVRQALYAALDRESVNEQIYYGVNDLTETFVPKKSFFYNAELPVQKFSLDEARRILDQAGWKPGADGIRAKNGVRLSFANSTTTGNALREQAQQLLQQVFAEIGVQMTISNLPPAVMWGDFWLKSQFDTAMVGITYQIASDPDVTNRFASTAIAAKGGSGSNTAQYVNPELDALLKKGARTFDRNERRGVYNEVQRIVRQDLPFMPLFEYNNVIGRKAELAGWSWNSNTRTASWNAASWYWDK